MTRELFVKKRGTKVDPESVAQWGHQVNSDDFLRAVIDVYKNTLSSRKVMEKFLAGWAGTLPKTFEDKKLAAEWVNRLASITNSIPVCHICNEPANLRAVVTLKYPDGVFQFLHTGAIRTTHQSGEIIPLIRLTGNWSLVDIPGPEITIILDDRRSSADEKPVT